MSHRTKPPRKTPPSRTPSARRPAKRPESQGRLVEDGGFLVYDGPLYGVASDALAEDPVGDLRDEVLDRASGRNAAAKRG